MCPRTSPAALTFCQQVLQRASAKARRSAPAQPVRKATGAAPDETAALQPKQPILIAGATPGGVVDGHDPRHGQVPIQHKHGSATSNMLKAAREMVLELSDPGSFHMTMLAM